MEDDLKALEEKLANLLRLHYDLRVENEHLKEKLSVAQSESDALKSTMLEASVRIETLMESLP